MRNRSFGLTLLATIAIVAAACSGAATPAPATGAPTPATTPAPGDTPAPTPEPPTGVTCDTALKVGLVTDVGRVNDKGFNQGSFEGMRAAQAEAPTCFDTTYIETTSQSDYAKNIAEFTDAGYDVVIGVGFLLGDALGDAAKANPNAKFISVDGIPGKGTDGAEGHDESWFTNGESLFFAEDQAGYLAGVLAASKSKSAHIGVVGGLVFVPPVERFVEGYIDGAKSVNPNIIVDFVYTTSFIDPPQGKNAAQQMIDKGADVIFAAGGLTGNGALSAACENPGVLAIGVDTDQYETLPEVRPCLLSSATKNLVEAVKNSLLRIAAGQFTAGVHSDDASTKGIGLAPFHDMDGDVSAETKALLETTYAGLADGSIKPNVVIDGQ